MIFRVIEVKLYNAKLVSNGNPVQVQVMDLKGVVGSPGVSRFVAVASGAATISDFTWSSGKTDVDRFGKLVTDLTAAGINMTGHALATSNIPTQ